METPILRTINKEIEDFKTKQIQVVPGFSFNQYDTVTNNIFYHNSKFVTGPIDEDGDRKYFYNINRNPCKVFSKAIDFDTKNIRLLTTESGDSLKTWFMERDLKFWMRDKQFGKVLNRIFKELPIYGSVVLKIVDGTPYFVDLRNFVVEQSAETLEDMTHMVEVHNFTVGKFRKVGKQMKWSEAKINKAIEEFYKMDKCSHIKVYERYGDYYDENGKYEYHRCFVADVGVDEYDQRSGLTTPKAGVELSSEPWEGNPYWEFHVNKVPGRWLGVGVVEELTEPQIKQNEIANLQSKGAQYSALRIWQTRDSAVNRNLLTDVRNGEILNVDSEITPVNMEDRNLAYFNQETDKWQRNRDELTFSYDAVQGERSPAGTPLGSTQISIGQTLSYFEGIQEEVAMDIKEMLYEVIIPDFQKKNTQEHTLRLVGADLDKFAEMVKGQMLLTKIIRKVANGDPIPTNAEKDLMEIAITESVKQNKERIISIPSGFYKDVKYDVDIDITGESVDTRVRYATRFALLQAITADPSMTTDPIKRKILYGMAEDGGVNPNELFDVESKGIESLPTPPGRAGGGVSAPQLQAPVPGQVNQTV